MDVSNSDEDRDGKMMIQASEDEDPLYVNNPIHDGPPQGVKMVGGLNVLTVVALATYKKWITYSYL